MSDFQLKQLAEMVDGIFLSGAEHAEEERIGTIFIDSRLAADTSFSLFFAIKGVRHDGHQYPEELYRKGFLV